MVAIPNPSAGSPRRIPIRKRISRAIANRMPKGLYARALLIIITPIVVLQSVVAFVFMERHWELVTRRLSTATTRDIAMLINVYESYPHYDNFARLIAMARKVGAKPTTSEIRPP